MLTKNQIVSNYKEKHTKLTGSYYSGKSGLTKEEFDRQHGKIWQDLDAELITAGYRQPSLTPRDLLAEIDSLDLRLRTLEDKRLE